MGIETYLEAFLFSLEHGDRGLWYTGHFLRRLPAALDRANGANARSHRCDAGAVDILYARGPLHEQAPSCSTTTPSSGECAASAFMFQLCELRKHQLVEAHVRLYVFRQDSYVERGEGVGAGSSGVGTSGTTMAAAVAPTASSSSADSHDMLVK